MRASQLLLVLVSISACKSSTKEPPSTTGSAVPTSVPAIAKPEPAAAKPEPATAKPDPEPPVAATAGSASDPVLAAMIGFRDRMCACKDEACIDAVNRDMNRFSNEQAVNPAPPVLGKDRDDKMVAVGKQLADCIQKVMTQD